MIPRAGAEAAGIAYARGFGAMLLAEVLRTWLSAILLTQVYSYFSSSASKRDPTWLKFGIIVLTSADHLALVFAGWNCWQYLIGSYGNFARLNIVNWSYQVAVILGIPAGTFEQTYFARRLYLAHKNYWPFSLATLCTSLLATALGLCSSVLPLIKTLRWTGLVDLRYALFISAHAFHFFTDVLVTVPLAYFLYKARKASGFRDTERFLSEIVIWVVSTGILTAAVVLLAILLFALNSHQFVWYIATNLLASLYLNSLVAFLNRRKKFASRRDANGRGLYFLGADDLRTSLTGDSIRLDREAELTAAAPPIR